MPADFLERNHESAPPCMQKSEPGEKMVSSGSHRPRYITNKVIRWRHATIHEQLQLPDLSASASLQSKVYSFAAGAAQLKDDESVAVDIAGACVTLCRQYFCSLQRSIIRDKIA